MSTWSRIVWSTAISSCFCLLFLLIVDTAFSAPIAQSPPEIIAFDTHQIDSPGHIFTMQPDGSDIVQLTTSGEENFTPRLSPNGQHVLFGRRLASNFDIYMVDIVNKSETRLTTSPAIDGNADWSPDGSTIILNTDRYGTGQDIAKFDLATDLVTQLTSTDDQDIRPIWSPDGSRIGFTRITPSSQELWTVAADGSGEERLCTPLQGTDFQWSPDMTKIAFISTGFPSHVHVMNVDCSGDTQITFGEDVDAFSWSPDGSKIVFDAGNNNATNNIYRTNIDGSGLVQIKNLGHRPDWGAVGPLDSDGDGIPDNQDSCPLEDARGQDANLDGCIDTKSDFYKLLDPLLDNAAHKKTLQGKLDECNKHAYEGKLNGHFNSGRITEVERGVLLAYYDNVCSQ